MKIQPTSTLKLLGTELTLKHGVEYPADWAQNQPNWQDGRKVFANSFLLSPGDYVISKPDRPVDLAAMKRVLKRWLLAVDIPDDNSVEDGELTLNDDVMREIIDATKRALVDIEHSLYDARQDLNSTDHAAD